MVTIDNADTFQVYEMNELITLLLIAKNRCDLCSIIDFLHIFNK